MEDLEARWKRCQELGVQADVELQRAARKVIEENNMLREILAELGVGREEVERRLRGFRAGSTASGNETGGDGGGGGVVPDNGCGGGGGVGTSSVEGFGGAGQQHFNFPGITTGLEAKSDAPAVPPGIESLDLSQLDLDIDIPEFGADAAAAGPATAVAVNETPDFSMSLMEPIQDFDNMFDISEFIEQPVKKPFCLKFFVACVWLLMIVFSSLTFPCQWETRAPPLLPHKPSRRSLVRLSQP